MTTPTPKQIELHIAPFGQIDFCKKYGRKVKALGGHYSECRGYSDRRFVTIPWAENTLELLNELVRNYQTKHATAIVRLDGFNSLPSHVVVSFFPKVLPPDPMAWLLKNFQHKFLNTVAKWPALAKE